MKKSGFDSTRRRLRKFGERADRVFEPINRESAEEIEDLAKVLVPQGDTGRARRRIRSSHLQGTSYLVSFGELAHLLEFGTDERVTEAGASRGRGPAVPFVFPAIRATESSRRARYRKGLKELARNG